MNITNKKNLIQEGFFLPVMEEFYSLQGEGFNTGTAAYFIRLGGCDIGCHWCDVKESWNAEIHPIKSIDEILKGVLNTKTQAVVLTGGEPTLYNLIPLTNILKKYRIKIFLETSGAYKISGVFDWICLSPKKNELPLPENFQLAHELKVIIHNRHDFIFAEKMAQSITKSIPLYLQPEWSKKDILLPEIIHYIQKNPQWKLSLQIHKYIHIP